MYFVLNQNLNIDHIKNAKEFLQAMKEHGPYYIRIDLKDQNTYLVPGIVYNNGFNTHMNTYCLFLEFFRKYEWQDGTICGILKEN